MNNKIRQFFDFNKKERIGILSLLVILIILIVIYYSLPQLVKTNSDKVNEQFKKQVEEFIEARKKEKTASLKQKRNTSQESIKDTKKLKPFPFNPNNLPARKWKKMGFSDKQVEIIKNYEKSGGKFYTKEDLKKIYGINQEEYTQLEPYIKIKQEKKEETERKEDSEPAHEVMPEKPKPMNIELNSADSNTLLKVKGIGTVFSSRIVKYRDYLGGFHSKEQLLEVYNLDSAVYQRVKENFWVDASKIEKINLNTATFKEILQHPYTDYYLVKQMVNYREKHGGFKKLSQLRELDLMYEELYEKLKPYLTLS